MPGQTVLIVEDDPVLLQLYSSMMESGGYQPLIAADARTAINLLKETTPHLIIQDLMLPDLNGEQLVHCIRQMPAGRDIPVIILSGSQARLEHARRSNEKFVAFLVKPVDTAVLLATVRKFLQN
jgi:CheY-like chemotaxis protein